MTEEDEYFRRMEARHPSGSIPLDLDFLRGDPDFTIILGMDTALTPRGEKGIRMGRDAWAMAIAVITSARSTCLRRAIGSVVLDLEGRVVGTGYNGAPRGLPHCIDSHCKRDTQGIESGTRLEICEAVHAEANALMQAGPMAEGGTLFTTILPCPECAKLIVNAKIARVVFLEPYSIDDGICILCKAGIPLEKWNESVLD